MSTTNVWPSHNAPPAQAAVPGANSDAASLLFAGLVVALSSLLIGTGVGYLHGLASASPPRRSAVDVSDRSYKDPQRLLTKRDEAFFDHRFRETCREFEARYIEPPAEKQPNGARTPARRRTEWRVADLAGVVFVFRLEVVSSPDVVAEFNTGERPIYVTVSGVEGRTFDGVLSGRFAEYRTISDFIRTLKSKIGDPSVQVNPHHNTQNGFF